MYSPPEFVIEQRPALLEFVRANAFGQLISLVDGQPVVTHLPFAVDADSGLLLAHLARANPQWRALDGESVLVTFQGPHAYVSPTWYAGPGVPTWNYQAVHVRGRCRVFDDSARLAALLASLSQTYEAGRDQPWNGDYDPRLLKGIVGLEIAIDDMQGKFKLSQNRPPEDRQRVAVELRAAGYVELAAAMVAVAD